ncbi:MAG: hypothetical protein F4Z79_07810 [Acidimicrobiia bacterium]|nr:hypothetical protein [bacterium]MXX01508.1 hypothetical protein [Acidimicrobiia bacterium]
MAKYWPTGLSEEEIFIAPSASRRVARRDILDIAALHNRHLESIEHGKQNEVYDHFYGSHSVFGTGTTRDGVLVTLGLREDVNNTTDHECLIFHAHYT